MWRQGTKSAANRFRQENISNTANMMKITKNYMGVFAFTAVGFALYNLVRDPFTARHERTDVLKNEYIKPRNAKFTGIKYSTSTILEKANESVVIMFGTSKSGKSSLLTQIQSESDVPVLRLSVGNTLTDIYEPFGFDLGFRDFGKFLHNIQNALEKDNAVLLIDDIHKMKWPQRDKLLICIKFCRQELNAKVIITTEDPDFKKYLGVYTPAELLEIPNILPEDFENYL